MNRTSIHLKFVDVYGWSSGRAFLLVDLMTEQREAVERMISAARKAFKHPTDFSQDRYFAALETAENTGIMAQDIAMHESFRKYICVLGLERQRAMRAERKLKGRFLP